MKYVIKKLKTLAIHQFLCLDPPLLPAKFGGLGIFKPQERCSVEYANSSKMIAGMIADVKEQKSMYNPDIQQAQKKIISVIKTEKQ